MYFSEWPAAHRTRLPLASTSFARYQRKSENMALLVDIVLLLNC